MKIQIPTFVGLLASVLLPVISMAQSTVKPECATVVEHLKDEVKKDPTRLLLAVEDALTLNDKCACEVVSTAIKISKADSDMVGRIVTTSVQASPTSASSIAECALAASPTSAAAIKKAMKAALGQGDADSGSGKDVVSNGKDVVGKEPVAMGKEVVGKEPVGKGKVPLPPLDVPPADPGDTFGSPGLSTSGIYLSTPGGGGGTVEKETKVIIQKETKIIRKVIRESTDSRCVCIK